MFQKRNSCSDNSRGTSTQMIVNKVPEQCKAEEKDSETDSEKVSIHSNWSKFAPVEVHKPDEVLKIDVPQRKRTVRNIVLVAYKPRPKDWRSWKKKTFHMRLALLLVLLWIILIRFKILIQIKLMKN